MFRDFSESAKTKLLEYVKDVTAVSTWEKVKDAIGDAGAHVQHWLGWLNVSRYVNDLDNYHRKVIDKDNITETQINQIFEAVDLIDQRYEKGLSGELTSSNNIVQFVQDLSRTISPFGGNLDMSKMSAVLQADIEQIYESQATMQKTVEDQMLGTEPEAASTSVDPVNLSTGNYVYDYRDIFIGGEVPLEFHRYYNSKDARILSMGKGFRHNYDIYISVNEDDVDLVLADGKHRHFKKVENEYIGINTNGEILTKENGCFRVSEVDGNTLFFNEKIILIRQENNNGLGISYTYNEKEQLVEARSDNGAYLTYKYNNDFICEVTDHTGRSVILTYDNNNLKSVQSVTGKVISYKYGINGRIVELVSSDTMFSVRNEYDNKFRVTRQEFPDGNSMYFYYDDVKRTVTQVERNGVKTVYMHDEKYRNTEIIYEDGTREYFIYNDNNQCIRYTDRLGNVQRMAYDNRGNLVQKIDALKRRYNMTYDAQNNLLSVALNGKNLLKNYYDKKGNLVQSENSLGNGLRLLNDDKGRPTVKIYPDGSQEKISYDEKGNISTITKPFGGTLQYFYDDLNQVSKVVDANGNVSAFEYNQSGNIVKETNALGNSRSYSYNKEGLLTGIVDYNGTKTSREYNNINQLSKFTDQAGNTTRLEYDSMWNISKMILPNGATTTYLFDRENRLTEVKNALGNSTYIKYNANGDCIAENIGDSRTEFIRDASGRLTKVKNPEGAIFEYEYDDADNIIHIKDALGNEVELEYDAAGQLICEKTSLGEIRKYTYTAMGDVATVENELGHITSYKYVPGGGKIESVTYADGSQEKIEYDLNGNISSLIDRFGNISTYKYDVLDRLTTLEINGNLQKQIGYDLVGNIVSVLDAEGNKTEYTYSVKGEMLRVKDALGNEAEYEYNVNGQLIKSIQKGNSEAENQSLVCERDILGQITSITDAAGNIESFKYDVKGQLIEKIDRDGYLTRYGYTKQGDVNYIQYADGREVKMAYNVLRHLEEVNAWDGVTKIQNDAIGRATKVEYPDGSKVSYTYNSAGKRTSITYPNGNTVYYCYDKFMRLSSLQDGEQVTNYEYNELGNLSKKTLPNGVETLYHYNKEGLLASLINKDKHGILDEYAFTYDVRGRKVETTKKRRDADLDSGSYGYKYDPLGRLVEVVKDESSLRSYEYDAFGNRTRLIEKGHITTYEYNNLNQLITKKNPEFVETYSYDKRGNLSGVFVDGKENYKYLYGALNRMEEAKNAEGITSKYLYNGLGHRIGERRIGSSMNPETTISYVLDMTRQYNNLLEREESGTMHSFLWDDKVVALRDNGSGDTNYYLQDEMGSPIRLMDKVGGVKETFGHDEFGNNIITNPNSINIFGFTGYQVDKTSGTLYAQAREYLPSFGRFAARDFVKGSQDDLTSINEYIYCKDDPIDYEDCNGLLLTLIAAGALIGGVIGAAGDAITQGIKIAQGKQESFQWGSFAGAAVKGTIMGGVSAVPGVGLMGTVFWGGVSSAADSTISQAIDDGSVNGWRVLEDAIVGGVTDGIFYGIDKAFGALKTKRTGEKPAVEVNELYKNTVDKIKQKSIQINAARSATGRTSPHRLRQMAQLVSEKSGLFRKFVSESINSGIKKTTTKSIMTIFNLKKVEKITEEVFGRCLPWYDDGETPLEYLEDYFGTLYGKFTGKCPLYA